MPKTNIKVQWSRKWPTKVGTYWFYGWDFGKDNQAEPHYHLINVHAISNGLMIVGDGHFWYPKEGADGWFTPAERPDKPQE